MPAQLSTILIFQNIGRKHQCFILLTKKNKPCYVPKLEEGQVLSIANSKFAIGPVDNQIDISTLIVTEEIQEREEQEESASILITPATTPATTPPSKKRVGHAKV
ncbi:hypothetical protein RhiirA5_375500 [Rhizophagus irregularis]|uniref:Uncharacterized protein n=1 Tax=Rhizophagus irregularis TaxID=588596 RepID=A0A2N0PRH5_9GLOM|nr:hypothetical protein RhiirA5_375500 [Rhizophagus irregularis]